jgi:hypothetical protein
VVTIGQPVTWLSQRKGLTFHNGLKQLLALLGSRSLVFRGRHIRYLLGFGSFLDQCINNFGDRLIFSQPELGFDEALCTRRKSNVHIVTLMPAPVKSINALAAAQRAKALPIQTGG